RGGVRIVLSGAVYLRQIAQLCVGGAVIDGGESGSLLLLNLVEVLATEGERHIDVLVPSAVLILVKQEVIGDSDGFRAAIPCGTLMLRVTPTNQLVQLRLDRWKACHEFVRGDGADGGLPGWGEVRVVGFALVIERAESGFAAFFAEFLSLVPGEPIEVHHRDV